MAETIEVQNIGKVKLKKSRKAKYLRISVAPIDGVRVTFPFYCTEKEVLKFLYAKKDWVIKNLQKAQMQEKKLTIFTPQTSFATRKHQLRICITNIAKLQCKITVDTINVSIPQSLNVEEQTVQSFIRKAIEETLRIEAKEYLPHRTQQLAKMHNFTYKALKVRNATSRWGSCSYQNSINLNLHLMQLPDHLIDYVILHELCHTVHKNHSKEFWNLLHQVSGKAKQLNKELKTYRIKIY